MQIVIEKKNLKIITICNKYNNILNDFINSSDLKSLNWPRSIDKNYINILISRNHLTSFPEEDCLNKNVLVSNKSSW